MSTDRRRMTDMTFGSAIQDLKNGHKVARKGWNGKGMFLMLVADWTVHSDYINDVKGLLPVAWIGMKTVDDCFVPWLASQTDMLAEDWEIIQ